jgi:Flp pilus assembly protein TadG
MRRLTPLGERRSIAAMEFAMVAPVIATLTVGVFDVGRALIVWQQLANAANAIGEAAEKLSITDNQGASATELTPQQMQWAMSSIYAQIPGLNNGNGTGIYRGSYSVTLSDVVFYPLCATSKGCAAQTPYTVWSTYLTEGGTQLIQPPAAPASQLLRPCYPTQLTGVAQWPDNSTELSVMAQPTLVNKGQTMTLTPQVVADVSYNFQPSFPFFVKPVTLWASASLPSPYGGLEQQVMLNAPNGTYNESTNPEVCPIPPGN